MSHFISFFNISVSAGTPQLQLLPRVLAENIYLIAATDRSRPNICLTWKKQNEKEQEGISVEFQPPDF